MGYREEVLKDGPLGYWRLDEMSSAVAADEAGLHAGAHRDSTQNQAPAHLALGRCVKLLEGKIGVFLDYKQRAKGAGAIPVSGGFATFSFTAGITWDGAPFGTLTYDDPSAGLSLTSTAITSFSVIGEQATFEGTATSNFGPITFVVTVTDGLGAVTDTFSIQTPEVPYAAGDEAAGHVVVIDGPAGHGEGSFTTDALAKATFKFDVKLLEDGTPSGTFEYHNPGTGLDVASTAITSVDMTAATLKFAGTGASGLLGAVTFSIAATFNGTPHVNDVIEVTIVSAAGFEAIGGGVVPVPGGTASFSYDVFLTDGVPSGNFAWDDPNGTTSDGGDPHFHIGTTTAITSVSYAYGKLTFAGDVNADWDDVAGGPVHFVVNAVSGGPGVGTFEIHVSRAIDPGFTYSANDIVETMTSGSINNPTDSDTQAAVVDGPQPAAVVPTFPGLSSDEVTVEAWVRMNADFGADFPFWTNFVNPMSNGQIRFASAEFGALKVNFRANAVQTVASYISDFLWHHVVAVVTREPDVVTFYVDGVPVEALAGLAWQGDPAATLDLGAAIGNTPLLDWGATGAFIDDVAVYGRALSAERVAAHFGAAFGPPARVTARIGKLNEPAGVDLVFRDAQPLMSFVSTEHSVMFLKVAAGSSCDVTVSSRGDEDKRAGDVDVTVGPGLWAFGPYKNPAAWGDGESVFVDLTITGDVKVAVAQS